MKISNKSLLVVAIATVLSSGVVQASISDYSKDEMKKERNARSVTIDKYGKIDTHSDRIAVYPEKALGLASVATDIRVVSLPEYNEAMNSFLMNAVLKLKAKISMILNPENITPFITFIEKNKNQITSLKIELRGDIPDEKLQTLLEPLSQLPSVILAVDEIFLDLNKQANRNAIFLKDELEKIGKSVQLENDQKKLITSAQLAEIRASLRSKD